VLRSDPSCVGGGGREGEKKRGMAPGERGLQPPGREGEGGTRAPDVGKREKKEGGRGGGGGLRVHGVAMSSDEGRKKKKKKGGRPLGEKKRKKKKKSVYLPKVSSGVLAFPPE